MTLQDLRYFTAVAAHRHFGRAAEACHVSQPTLSAQLKKLEDHLGVTLFERTNRSVSLTAAGEAILEHARRALEQIEAIHTTARAQCDPLSGPLRLGVIPTLAPGLMARVLGPLRESSPGLTIELWEDLTSALLERVRDRSLDAALIATEPTGPELTGIALFDEPFLAALPGKHPLAHQRRITESDLAGDLLVLADGHCLAAQALAACRRPARGSDSFRAASLETLVSLVAAGYGTTLIPALAAESFRTRNVILRPVAGNTTRTIRLISRPTFPRPQALRALERTIRRAIPARMRFHPQASVTLSQ